jgi:DNA-binding LacI/PurR family transcriptional regulator
MLELQKRGIVYSRVGSGSFVAPRSRRHTILIVSELEISLAKEDMESIQFLGYSLLRCNRKHADYTVSAIDYAEMEQVIDTIEVRFPNLKGVIFVRRGERVIPLMEILTKKGIAAAFWGSSTYMPKLKDMNHLVYDEKKIIYSIMDYFLSKGRQKIGMVYNESFVVALERFKQYRNFLKQHGLKYNKDWTLGLEEHPYKTEIADAFTTRKFLMNLDAIVCADDAIAKAIIERAVELGFKVPEELSVIGINDVSFCKHVSPSISSVAIRISEDASNITDLLVDAIENDTTFKQTSNTDLILRASSD